MTDDDRKRAAQAILEFPFALELFAEIEAAATNQCIFAKMNDDETRRNAAAEVRAIRNVLSRLRSIAGQTETVSRRAPA
jgi:hypothetical protein